MSERFTPPKYRDESPEDSQGPFPGQDALFEVNDKGEIIGQDDGVEDVNGTQPEVKIKIEALNERLRKIQGEMAAIELELQNLQASYSTEQAPAGNGTEVLPKVTDATAEQNPLQNEAAVGDKAISERPTLNEAGAAPDDGRERQSQRNSNRLRRIGRALLSMPGIDIVYGAYRQSRDLRIVSRDMRSSYRSLNPSRGELLRDNLAKFRNKKDPILEELDNSQ